MRVLLIASSTLLANVWDDSRNLLCLFRVIRFEVNCWRQAQATCDAVRNAVRSSDCMTNAMAQANATGIHEREQRRITCEEELRAYFCIFWVGLRLREVGEEIFDGFETHALGGYLGGERMVHELDCMVQGSYL